MRLLSIRAVLLFIIFFYLSSNGFANDRTRECFPSGGNGSVSDKVTVEPLTSYKIRNTNPDLNFNLLNPICLTIAATTYAPVKVAIAGMTSTCLGKPSVRIAPSPILDAIDFLKSSTKALTSASCSLTVVGTVGASQIFAAEIAAVYGIAKSTFEKTNICGANWFRWNSTTMKKDIPEQKNKIEEWITNNPDKLNFDYQEYREWFYNGVEREDNIEYTSGILGEKCLDVTRRINNGNGIEQYPAQRYYYRGLQVPTFNCEHYNIKNYQKDPLGSNDNTPFTEKRIEEFKEAYKCCIKRSQETICIESNKKYCDDDGNNCKYAYHNHVTCKVGKKCALDIPDVVSTADTNVTFEGHYYDNRKMICAKSWSLCPYNFNIQGGSISCDYYKDGVNGKPISPEDIEKGDCNGKSEIRNNDCSYNDKANKCKNYCQQLNHCVRVSNKSQILDTEKEFLPYLSRACIDFIGDSKNRYEYNGGLIGNSRHFTAPISQCFKETLENIFYNKAGHTLCTNGELGNVFGLCYLDDYVHKKGDNVEDKSIFKFITDNLRIIFQVVLSLAITIFGIRVLIGDFDLKRKEIILLAVKLSLVVYFVMGDAWHSIFFKGIYNASSGLSNIVLKVISSEEENKKDGCQFGTINTDKEGRIIESSVYPEGKEYIAIFDTLDCKISRYLGYGPNASFANIFLLILAGIFTGPAGIFFATILLLFGVFIILIAIRVVHIFIISSLAIILLVYVSPIVIPTALFSKTKKIFRQWFENLINYTLHPIILFAYVGIVITLFDSFMIGSASFQKTGISSHKKVICDKVCIDNSGNKVAFADQEFNTFCKEENGYKILDPKSDSVLCIVNATSVNNNAGFGLFDLAINLIDKLLDGDIIQVISTLLKSLFVLYIMYQLISHVPVIANQITFSGTPLSNVNLSITKAAGSVYSGLRGSQKRATRFAGKSLRNYKNYITRKNSNHK